MPDEAAAVEEAAPASTAPMWGYALGAMVLLAAMAGVAMLLRRRRSVEAEPVVETSVEDGPAGMAMATETVPTAPIPDVPAALADRARLEVTVTPRRAGVNMVTATVDIDVVVHNVGPVAAQRVAIAATLASATAGQERVFAELFAAAPRQPAVAPFTLMPGDRRSARILVTMPRQDIVEMRAGQRPMFVPLVAIDVRYADENGTAHQHAQAIAVGIERADSPKLAPFWLDAPARMFDTVAARPHGAVVDR